MNIQMTDFEIWQNIKAGDKQSLSIAYDKYIDDLISYGSRYSRDTSLVEDCLHDLFVYVWKNRENLSDTDSIKNYLMVSLRRSIIRKGNKLSKSQNDITDYEYKFSSELSIEEMIVNGEISRENALKLKSAFQNLSDRQREAVYLKYYEEKDYDEICTILDISYQSVRNLVSSGIKRLREAMTLLFWLLSVIN